MKDYNSNNLRNVGIMGHSATGKTSLVESLLFAAKIIDKCGTVEEGNTISDFDKEEKLRKISINSSIIPFEYEGNKINLVDTPGYFDFQGEVIQGMRPVDVGTIVVCGVTGPQVGTEKAWDYCNKINLPRNFFINKLDRENANFENVLNSLKEKFGISVVPIQYPIGDGLNFKGVINVITKRARIYNEKTKMMEVAQIPSELVDKVNECKDMIIEAVAQTSEELLDKFVAGEELTDLELYEGLIDGCTTGDIAPVMCGSALKGIGINTLLEDIIECFPSPKYAIPQKAIDEKNEEIYVKLEEDSPFSAFVFKTVMDPFVGKISLFRVITGALHKESSVLNMNKNKAEKISNIFFLRGKTQIPTNVIVAGDIGAVAKLQYTSTGDTLCDSSFKVKYDKINFPEPVYSMAVIPKTKVDEDKISFALSKLNEEDPILSISKDLENAETIITGLGDTHLDIIKAKLKSKYNVEAELRDIKIPYRETIKGHSDVQGKHKKQSGGHGQYGDVKIKFERRKDQKPELEFVDKVVGGAVPRNFIPAVEKGLVECMNHGVLAGYPVIELKATLYDGSYHPVDSSEMAFKMAASLAYKKGLAEAKPILLEPIMHVEVMVPDEYMGDVMGGVNKKRGRVLGMNQEGEMEKLIVEAPMAEIMKFSTDLKSLTQGRGSYTMRLERYEEVPEEIAEKIIQENK